ncbi:tetratricopeptide repeat protein [Smaragdicoccus niigatensis]|uniref:tetratricopeptide repeat protein n=1 Tax=Smaragdicoccus niigatensis TaxID=359359 RepID=UPI00037ABE47|nr:tetratricopeptide repeat protein [Smaragdicoccus niigatensis]
MDFVDYYALLDIPRSADAAAIADAVRAKRKEWTKRQNHPNPDIRQTAEKQVHLISEAERVLSAADQRRAYDQQLAAHQSAPPPPPSSGDRNWLAIAEEYLSAGNEMQASYAAREATTQQPDNPQAWYIRAQASMAQDLVNDAQFEISEAIRLNPNDPRYLSILGDIYIDGGNVLRAREAYEKAQKLDPTNPFYAVGIADTYPDNPELQIPIYERAVAENPGIDYFTMGLAIALFNRTWGHLSRLADGSRIITNVAQIESGRATLARIRALNLPRDLDPEFAAGLAELSRIVDGAERVRWYGSDNMAGYGGGLAVATIAMLILFGGGDGGLGFLAMLTVAGIIAIYVVRHRMPEWKRHSKIAPKATVRSGLQVGAR